MDKEVKVKVFNTLTTDYLGDVTSPKTLKIDDKLQVQNKIFLVTWASRVKNKTQFVIVKVAE